MKRKRIRAGSIKSAGYEKTVLELEFSSGAVYQWQGVSKVVWLEFLAARLKDRYFANRILNLYPWHKVKEKQPHAPTETKAPPQGGKDRAAGE